jgi:hypothetical protein
MSDHDRRSLGSVLLARPIVRYRRSRRAPGPAHVLLALALAIAATALSVSPPTAALPDTYTVSQDTLRTGWDPAEPGLAANLVTGSNFGQLFTTPVNGQVYAQPLVVGNTVLVSTENDWVYGLDAVTGAIRWSDNFGPTWPASTIGCADLSPNIGSTSTGVYDPSTSTYYLTTKVDNGVDAAHPKWYLHAVDVATGAERSGWPTQIVGTPANDPSHPFNAETVNQRPGLLLMNGVVYLAFGSQCDLGSYVGWVVGVNTVSHSINMWSPEVGLSSKGAGVWQSGGGIMSDGSGRMFVSTGNGVTTPAAPGSSPPPQLSESVIRLGVDASGAISAHDFFSPSNASVLDQNDQDLGAGGPVALPSQYFGTPTIPDLMVQIGKDGRLFLLNRDHLGGKGQAAGGGDDVVQALGPYQGVWGHPAVYGGEGGYVYVVTNYNKMLAFRYGTDGSGHPALSLAGNSAESFGYTSGSPVVTSNGTSPGSAVVWVVNVDNSAGANGRLCAYNAVPSNAHLNLLRCFPIGNAAKFPTPATSNGRIYVGTRDGDVYGFGQPTTAALNLPQTNFGDVAVSTTGTSTVTATATRTVTINSIATSAPFAATPPPLPLTLAAGQTINVPVSFTPTSPGSFTGTLNFSATDAGNAVTLGAALQGTAVQPGFTGSPAQVDFGQVVVGASKTLTASFVNSGTADETVSGASGPSAPFTVTGLPSVGTVVAPGQAVAVSVTYTPTAATTDSSSITVAGPDGSGTVQLTGQGATGTAKLSISPASLDFGSVAVGLSATMTLSVSNPGNLNVTITKAAPPALPFVVNTPLPEGLVLGPGQSVQVQVTFAPTVADTFNDLYVISSDDGNGAHNIPVTGTATNPSSGTPLPSIVGGTWIFNGSANMSGTNLVLTPATSYRRGSAVFSNAIPSDGLTASFTAQIGGGTRADGLTFAMLDASTNTVKSLGTGGGAGLGFYGLPGVAVTLVTHKTQNDPSGNFIGLTTGGANGALTYVATATNVPDLRTGTHAIVVSAAGGTVSVSIDGTQVISATVSLPPSILPAFTAATGTLTDVHTVSNVSVRSGGTVLPAPGTGWRFNKSAVPSGSQTVLTPAQTYKAGSALYSSQVFTNGLTATFQLSMSGGTGGQGMTFALLDPTSGVPTAVGSSGSGLGFGGLQGVAVAFVTQPQSGIQSANFVGIATSTTGGKITFVASTTNIPSLRAAPHEVLIQVVGDVLTVSIGGTQVLSSAVPSLTPTALVGYTASTGASTSTDVHTVSVAQIIGG